jgi:hypothetical protein
MIPATFEDKKLIIDILSQSFDTNKSVNYVVKQDSKRKQRIRKLMDYVFEMCWHYGEIYLSPDKDGVVLILLPDKKKSFWKTTKLDLSLALHVVGPGRVVKVLRREGRIKKYHPAKMIYLWFIGIEPGQQGKGIGSRLLKGILELSTHKNLPVYLETSTQENVPFYQKAGFQVYQELNFGSALYLFRREVEDR